MLKGDCTGLRAIEKGDLPFLLSWRNQPELRQYFREYRELSVLHQNRWYEQIQEDSSTLMFAISELLDNKLIGAAGLCNIDWKNQNAELSLYIGYDTLYVDDKYAPDVVTTLMKYAFEELGIHRLWAEVFDFDIQKQLLFESMGFKKEGLHKHTYWSCQKWHDSVFYSILNFDEFMGGSGSE